MSISFWTPIVATEDDLTPRPLLDSEENSPPYTRIKITRFFDDYFSFPCTNTVAVWIHPNQQHLENHEVNSVQLAKGEEGEEIHWLSLALKIISYFTLIIPLIMLIGKVICRTPFDFKAVNYAEFYPPKSHAASSPPSSL